jgi:hypothetical protein
MATSLTLQNDASLAQGYVKVNGTTSATFTTSGITGNLVGNVTGSLTQGGSLTLATAQTASGTAVDFTGIPSWAKRITVIFKGVSLDGANNILVRLGAGSSPVSVGYTGTNGSWFVSLVSTLNTTNGFGIRLSDAAATFDGCMNIQTIGSNIWISNHIGGGGSYVAGGGGSITLSGTLDRLQILPTAGSFDAGTINISYEG